MFLFGLFSKFKVYLITLGILAVFLGTLYVYFNHTEKQKQILMSQIASLQASIQIYDEANKQNLETIDDLLRFSEENTKIYNDTISEYQVILSQKNELSQRLEDRDLNKIALAKPELMEKILNGASKNAIRCFELISGVPLTLKEKQAKTGQEFNAECPWLFDEIKKGN